MTSLELTDDILIDWNCGRSTAIWMVEAGQIINERKPAFTKLKHPGQIYCKHTDL